MKNYARFFGGIGLVFIIFGAVASATLQGAMRSIAVAELILGLLGVALFVFYFLGDTLQTLSRTREAIFGIFGVVILLMLLIGANIIAHSKFGERKFDTTVNKIHSLSNESAKLLKGLNTDIEIVSFFQNGARQRSLLDDLIGKYTYVSPRLKYRAIDPDKEPATVKAYEAAQDEVVVKNLTTKKSMKLGTLTEEALTSALKKVMSEKTKKVYFLQGHGEGDLEDDKTAKGLFIAKVLLENEGYSVQGLNLAAKPEIPADAHIIAAWGAERPYTKAEADTLIRFLDRGGNLVVGQDPLLSPTKDKLTPNGLEPVLARMGLEFKPSVLLEYQMQIMRGKVINAKLAITGFSKHAIVSGLGAQAIAEFSLAQPVLQIVAFKDSKVTRDILLSSSENSWAETNIASAFVDQKPTPQGDQTGPLALGEVAELEISDQVKDAISKKGKLVVFGDSDFGSNGLIQGSYNRDLFLNSFNFMGGEEASLSIRPKTWTQSTLEIDPATRRFVYFASIFAIPQFIMCLGIAVWLVRRSRSVFA